METFGFEATITDPPSLTSAEQEALRRRFEESGMTKVRLRENSEVQTRFSFPVEAANGREVLDKGLQIALSALAVQPYVSVVGGLTHRVDE